MKDATPRKILDMLCVSSGLLVLVLGLLRIFVVFSICIIGLPLLAPLLYFMGLILYAWFKSA